MIYVISYNLIRLLTRGTGKWYKMYEDDDIIIIIIITVV